MRTPVALWVLVASASAFVPGRALANEGTVRRFIMPVAATLGVAIPHFNYYFASQTGQKTGFGFRAAPVSFFADGAAGEVVFVPFTDVDLAPDWASTTRVRLAHGLRTLYFPFKALDFIGVLTDGGGSVGFGGPSGFVGGGLVFGGKMGTLSLSYRRAWGRDENIHTLSAEVGLTYPIRIGASRPGE